MVKQQWNYRVPDGIAAARIASDVDDQIVTARLLVLFDNIGKPLESRILTLT